MTKQYTVLAPTEADLAYVLTEAGILVGGQPAPGMGYAYRGAWSIGGAQMASVHALVWWNAEAADEVEQATRDTLLEGLNAVGALYLGQEQPTQLLGTSGPEKPDPLTAVGIIRDHQKTTQGFKVGEHWFHSDLGSRIQLLGLAIAVLLDKLPPGQLWKTMSGEYVPLTKELVLGIFQAAMVSDGTYHAIGEQARAALKTGGLKTPYEVQWPDGFKKAPK